MTSHVQAGKHLGMKVRLGLRKNISPLKENVVLNELTDSTMLTHLVEVTAKSKAV